MSRRSGNASTYEDQGPFEARFDWGSDGLEALSSRAAVVVIVDVFSFGTAVAVAVGRGAEVVPCHTYGDEAEHLAASHGAVLAARRNDVSPSQPFSLSPASLRNLPSGTRLVLPSPNGSRLSAMAYDLVGNVLAGCLRNASAVGRTARTLAAGGPVAVIAAGERWGRVEGPLRPAVEDVVGAGAVLAAFDSDRPSPEAVAAIAVFRAAVADLPRFISDCASGRELSARGFSEDVGMASELDADDVAPVLRAGIFAAD